MLRDDDVQRLRTCVVGEDTFDRRFALAGEATSGGMSRVFEATDRSSNSRVAVKLILAGADRARFAAESEILERLHHGAIVRHVCHGLTVDGVPYLAMEWLTGEPLSARLERGPLTADEACALGERVADALDHAHRAGVIHRDLKPSNIFLVDGRVEAAKVIDFGIAKGAQRNLTQAGQLVGTPGYMAPEQARGDRAADRRIDLFALGCVLYEALSARRPFEGANVMDILARLLLEKPAPIETLVPEIPTRLAHLIAALLAKEPARRASDARIVRSELTAIRRGLRTNDANLLAERPAHIPAQSHGITRATPRKATRRRWPLVVGLVAAVAGATGAIVYVTRDEPVATPVCTTDDHSGCAALCETSDPIACERHGLDAYAGVRGYQLDKLAGVAKLTRACELGLGRACVAAASRINELLKTGNYPKPRTAALRDAEHLFATGCDNASRDSCFWLGKGKMPPSAPFGADADRGFALIAKSCRAGFLEACTYLHTALAVDIGSPAARATARKAFDEACAKKLVPCAPPVGSAAPQK